MALHSEFFSVHDLIQTRYEMVRVVNQDKVPIVEAVRTFGFKSRSSYYLFGRLIREQGFVGLFDMRPLNRRICEIREGRESSLSDICIWRESVRPKASIWKPSCGPWHNAFYGLTV